MKIICSDYDGTLNHGGITEKKLRAIKKWQEAGNLFCVVSGRGKEFFSELKERNIPSLKVLYSTEVAKSGQRTPQSIAFCPSVAGILIAIGVCLLRAF